MPCASSVVLVCSQQHQELPKQGEQGLPRRAAWAQIPWHRVWVSWGGVQHQCVVKYPCGKGGRVGGRAKIEGTGSQ